jgi:hypothetical protein
MTIYRRSRAFRWSTRLCAAAWPPIPGGESARVDGDYWGRVGEACCVNIRSLRLYEPAARMAQYLAWVWRCPLSGLVPDVKEDHVLWET